MQYDTLLTVWVNTTFSHSAFFLSMTIKRKLHVHHEENNYDHIITKQDGSAKLNLNFNTLKINCLLHTDVCNELSLKQKWHAHDHHLTTHAQCRMSNVSIIHMQSEHIKHRSQKTCNTTLLLIMCWESDAVPSVWNKNFVQARQF